MAGTEQTKESMADTMLRSPLLDGSVARMMGWPVEVWLRCQEGILKAAQPAASEWFERRREAATATLQTLEKMSACSDLKELAAVQRSWFEGTMHRFDTDLQAIADQAVAVSQEALSATRYAAETSSEVVAFAIQPIQRAVEDQQQRAEEAATAAAA